VVNPLSTRVKESIRAVTRCAGAEMLARQESCSVTYKRAGEYHDDPQAHTDVDDFIEKLFTEAIEKVSRYDVLTEGNGRADFDTEYIWIVDPIDGTAQFHRGLPLYASSVALCSARGYTAVWGLVYAPALDLLFEAEKGKGATCNGQAIRAASSRPNDEILASISAYGSFKRVHQTDLYLSLVRSLRHVRQFGCPSLDICFVASGRLDVRVVAGFKIWDIAAAALIATEAGAEFRNLATGDLGDMNTQVGVIGSPPVCELVSREVCNTTLVEW